jgi:K+-sensing histidine kinase KdpD
LLELKRAPVDLAAVVRSAVESARPWFEQRSQTISVEIPDEMRAYADETRVAQIVTNLLHNAAKFTPNGGSIRLELALDADTALARVIDSGWHPPDELDRMFDMFLVSSDLGQCPARIGNWWLSRGGSRECTGTLTASSDGEGRATLRCAYQGVDGTGVERRRQ